MKLASIFFTASAYYRRFFAIIGSYGNGKLL